MSIRTFNGRGRNGRGARMLAATLVFALVLQPLAATAGGQTPPPTGQADPFQPFVPPPAAAPLKAEIADYNKRLYDELIQTAGSVEGPRIIDDVTYPTYTIAGMVLTSKVYVRQLMSFISQISDLAGLTREQKIARITRMMAHAAEAQRWNALARSVYSNAVVRMGNTTVGQATYRLIDAELAAARARGDAAGTAFLEHARTLRYDDMAQAFDQRRLQAQDQDPLLSVNFFWRELAQGGDPASFIGKLDATARAAIDQAHAEINRVRDISTVGGYTEFLKDKYSRTRAAAAGLLGDHSVKLISSLQEFAAAHESLRGTQQQVEQLEIALIVGGIAVVAIFVAPAAALAGTAYVPAAELTAAGLAVLGTGVQLVHDGGRLYAIQTELTNTERGQGVLGAAAVEALRHERSAAVGGLLLDTAFAALSVAQLRAARTALHEARVAREAEQALANAVPAGAAAVTHNVADAAGILRRIDAAALKAHARVGSIDPAFLTNTGLAPQRTVQIGGHTFHLSAPFNGIGGRATVIAFQETGAGTVIPRTFYMSGEHGVWRAATGYSELERLVLKGPRLSDGRFVNESAADIAAELQGPLSRWASERPMLTLADDVASRAAYGHLEGGFVGNEFGALVKQTDALGTLPRAPGAAPNFAAGPLDRWTYRHPEYGLVEGFTYASHDGDVIYVVLRDARGRVFVPSIQQGDATITGFGTRGGAISSDFTVPPLMRGRAGYVDNPDFGNNLANLFHDRLPPVLPGSSALPGTAAAAGGAGNPAAINALASTHPAVQRGAQRALELGATADDVNAMLRIAANPDPRVGLEAGKALAQIGELDDLIAAARRAGVAQAEIDAMMMAARGGGVIGLADMPVALLRAAANQQRVPILVDTAWDVVDRTGRIVVADAPGTRLAQFFRDTLPDNVIRTDLVALFNLRANLSFLKSGRAVALTPEEMALLRRVLAHPDASRMYAFVSDERVLLRVFDDDLLQVGRGFLNAANQQTVAAGAGALPAAAPVAAGGLNLLPAGLLVLAGQDASDAMQRQIDRATSPLRTRPGTPSLSTGSDGSLIHVFPDGTRVTVRRTPEGGTTTEVTPAGKRTPVASVTTWPDGTRSTVRLNPDGSYTSDVTNAGEGPPSVSVTTSTEIDGSRTHQWSDGTRLRIRQNADGSSTAEFTEAGRRSPTRLTTTWPDGTRLTVRHNPDGSSTSELTEAGETTPGISNTTWPDGTYREARRNPDGTYTETTGSMNLGPPPPASPPADGTSRLPDALPLGEEYADGSLGSVRLALDDALQAAGFDMEGSFRMNAADGTVTYEDGDVKVTGRARDGQLIIEQSPADEGTTGSTGRGGQPVVDPIEFEILPGAKGPEPDEETALHLDDLGDLMAINDPSVMNVSTDATVQAMIGSFRGVVVQPAGSPLSMLATRGRRVLGAIGSLLPGRRGVAAATMGFGPHAESRRDVWLAPLSAGVGRDDHATHPVRMVLTSLGTSTGEAFDVQIVNEGLRPVRLSGAIVLEPIAKASQAAVQRNLQRTARPGAATARVDAYCLEFLRQPPSAGTLFRIAPPEIQKKFAPMRNVLNAARRLHDAGLLTPDGDPEAYYHAITNWAIWTKTEQFTLDSFGKAFIEHTKKNVQAAGRPWTQQLEQALHAVVPGRWRDITRVLADAETGIGGAHAQR
jgi:hypothetical protein